MSPHHRPHAPRVVRSASRAVGAGLLALLGGGALGCEWVMDGVPNARPRAGSADGGGVDTLPPTRDGGVQADSGVLNPDRDTGVAPPLEAGPEPIDGGPGPADTGAPPPSCVPGKSVYRDVDGDGYGTGVPLTLSCPAAFPYSEQTGDCDDENPNVFPSQTRFFGTAYRAPDGSQSFDYDCSGSEEGNGRQAVLGNCGLLGALLCQGKGYAPGDRFATFGINTACGSTLVQECKAEVLGTASCRASAGVKAEPFVCR